jgi:hypothetical protein
MWREAGLEELGANTANGRGIDRDVDSWLSGRRRSTTTSTPAASSHATQLVWVVLPPWSWGW